VSFSVLDVSHTYCPALAFDHGRGRFIQWVTISTQIPSHCGNWRCELDVCRSISGPMLSIPFLIGPAKTLPADLWYTVEASSEAVGLSDTQMVLDRRPELHAAMHRM
jgi:hypothetical protein